MLAILAAFPALLLAQDGPAVTPTVAPPATDDEPSLQAPERIDVQPLARDDQIRQRLENILKATEWFANPEVRVQDGVVFLMGQTETSEFKTWAGDLAHSTQDVAAVVNQIEVIQPSVWDFQPALAGLRQLWRDVLRGLPLVGFSLLVLAVAWGAARLAIGAARAPLRRRLTSPLLINVMERGVGSAVFLVGLYVVFHVAGLTGVALTPLL